MTVNTKFEPNQKVWFIHNSKATERTIRKISIDLDQEIRWNKTTHYFNENEGTENPEYKCLIVDENLCFATREELINSL